MIEAEKSNQTISYSNEQMKKSFEKEAIKVIK